MAPAQDFFWDFDWRLKIAIGLAIVLAGLLLLRPPAHRPLRFALAMATLETGALVAIRGVVAVNDAYWWQFFLPFALVMVPSIFATVVLTRLKWWRAAGFTAPRDWRNARSAGLLALTLVLPLFGLSAFGFKETTAELLAFQVAFLLLGVFMEEAIFRGIILTALRPYGPIAACLLSGSLFGLSHLDNLFLRGSELAVFSQVFEAGLIGILFSAVRLRMNAIWPVVAAHATYDFMLVLAYGHAVPVDPTIPGFAIDTVVNFALAAVALHSVGRLVSTSSPDRRLPRDRAA